MSNVASSAVGLRPCIAVQRFIVHLYRYLRADSDGRSCNSGVAASGLGMVEYAAIAREHRVQVHPGQLQTVENRRWMSLDVS